METEWKQKENDIASLLETRNLSCKSIRKRRATVNKCGLLENELLLQYLITKFHTSY